MENFRVRRHRVTILRQVEYDWQPLCEIWAEFRGAVVTTRYISNVVPGMRLQAGKEVFKVMSVVDRPTKKSRLVEIGIEPIENPGVGGFAPCATAMNSNGLRAFAEAELNASQEVKQKC
jgi:hypothetical protein